MLHSLKNGLTFATNTPITAVASSGPEEPAAMKVAPATSGGRLRSANQDLNTLQKTSENSIFGIGFFVKTCSDQLTYNRRFNQVLFAQLHPLINENLGTSSV